MERLAEALQELIDAQRKNGGGEGDPTPYLRSLAEVTGWIDLRGFKMESEEATRIGIEELYIALTTTLAEEPSGSKRGRGDNASGLEPRASARINLEGTLKHRLAVVVGDPGGGRPASFVAWRSSCANPCSARSPVLPKRNWASPASPSPFL